MGFMGSTLLAMFRKLGAPVKTVVSAKVLDAVAAKDLTAAPLPWGAALTGRVANGQAAFYSVDIFADHLAAGFALSAECSHGRVKALLWDMGPDGEWSMAANEDAVRIGATNVAALLHTGGDTLDGVPRSVQAHLQAAAVTTKGARADPTAAIFRALDGARHRDRLSLKPGTHLLAGARSLAALPCPIHAAPPAHMRTAAARCFVLCEPSMRVRVVYGDNFLKRASYTVRAIELGSDSARAHVAAAEATDRALLDERSSLAAFEKEFSRARSAFEAVRARALPSWPAATRAVRNTRPFEAA